MRGYLAAFALIGALAFAACGESSSSTPTATRSCENPRPGVLAACADTSATPTPAARTPTTPAPRTPPPALRTPTPGAATVEPPASTATPAPTGESGIEGTVTIGPTCPVQRIDSPCPDRPYEATISVLDSAGRKVAEARSGADGRFRLLLPAGTYTLRPESSGAFPHAREQSVVVENGRITPVQIVFDSGIR